MGFLKEFKEFAMKGNLVDIAVGFVMGAAFKEVVSSFTGGIVSPLIGLLFKADFNDLKYVITEGTVNDAGETVNQTEWHNIVVWGKRVAVVEKYLQKGSEVCITGKLTYRSYEDKDGVKRHITEIKANEIVMLGGKKDGNGSTDDSKEEE